MQICFIIDNNQKVILRKSHGIGWHRISKLKLKISVSEIKKAFWCIPNFNDVTFLDYVCRTLTLAKEY